MQHILHTPLTKQALAPLKAGDTVLLSGVVYTARDAAHARMAELLDKGDIVTTVLINFRGVELTKAVRADALIAKVVTDKL